MVGRLYQAAFIGHDERGAGRPAGHRGALILKFALLCFQIFEFKDSNWKARCLRKQITGEPKAGC